MSTQKFALVTGGTRGIGRAITCSLLAAGYRVLAVYQRNRELADTLTAEALANGHSLHCLRADLADEEGLNATLAAVREATPKVDVIVHSAASGVHRPTTTLTQKHLAWTFRVNFFAIQNLLGSLIPMMEAGGRIIGLTSIGGTRSLPNYGAVGSSKGALEALFRHYAYELAPRGIAVNLICPGLVMTESVNLLPNRKDIELKATARTPSGRLTSPEDVAKAVVFLASEGAGQIVGQTLTIDGGFWLA